MRVRAPLMSLDVRGRYGSALIFSIWKGRNYAKQMTVPTNPQSSRQMTIRAIMVDMTRAWGALTDDQRVAWNAFAESRTRKNVFGEDVRVSGFNEYVSLAVLAVDMGETQVADPPISDPPGSCSDCVVAPSIIENGVIDINWTNVYSGIMNSWIAGPLPVGRKASKSDFRHKAYIPEIEEEGPIEGLIAGSTYEVKVRIVRANGQVGPFLKFRTIASSGL